MTGKDYLDYVVGDSATIGMLEKNINDTQYRNLALKWTNLVIKDISNRQQTWHWRWLEITASTATIASTHTYDLPSDIDTNKLFALYEQTNQITFTYIPYEQFVKLVAKPLASTGTAILWTFWGSKIRLYPVPSAAITIYLDYIKTITALTDSALSTTDVPAKYDPVIIDGILTYAYKFDKDMGDWAKQQGIYEAGVMRMIQDNGMMINELGRSESHRTRLTAERRIGYPGGLFPLAQ